MSLSRRKVEDRLPLERVPLACTFGLPLDLHLRQGLSLHALVDLDHHRVEFLVGHQQWLPMFVHNLTVHPGAVWLVQSELDLMIAGPGHCGQLGIDCPQPFVRNGVRLAQCLHLETMAFFLRLDLLWGWLNLYVGAMSLLTWSLLLPCPSRRHYARELLRDRMRGLCLRSAVVVVTPVCCCTPRQDAVLVTKSSCVRTQVWDMQALLGLKPVRFSHQNAGATGSAANDPVQGCCFS